MVTINDAFQKNSRNHVLLPICVVLAVELQNPVRLFLLEDHCGVLLPLRYLAEFGRMFGLQNFLLANFAEPLANGNM